MDRRGKEIKIEPETPESSDQEHPEEVASARVCVRNPLKRKYRRHSYHQIQQLEEFYREYSHPDKSQRQELAMRLGLEEKQVKFWFQNRRTQVKIEKNRQLGLRLRQESKTLHAENIILRHAMAYPVCSCCNQPVIRPELAFEEAMLQYENARIRSDIERLCCFTRRFMQWSNWNWTGSRASSSSAISSSSCPAIEPNGNSLEILMTESVNEVAQMSCIGEPIWTKSGGEENEKLNLDEYFRKFFPCSARKVSGIVHEASRAIGFVSLDASFLVEKLMDLDRWTEIFPSIVVASSTEKVILNDFQGIRNQDPPLLQVDFLPVLSTLAPTRPVKFLRFCKQHDSNTWIVLDVSPDLRSKHPNLLSGFTRFPSGFVIQGINNEYSKVIIVDHWEYEQNAVPHQFRTYLSSRFDAQRWLNALQRYGFKSSIPSLALYEPMHRELSSTGKTGLLNLSGRMVNTFCAGLCGLTDQRWEKFPTGDTDETINIFTRKNRFWESPCTLVSAVGSVWMSVEPDVMFGLLCDARKLSIWEHLRHDSDLHELFQIARGTEPGNHVSIFARGKSFEENNMIVLQETYNYAWGSLIVHAPVDSSAVISVMNGGDSSDINLLPFGFTVLPGCCGGSPEVTVGSSQQKPKDKGCLLTVGFQITANRLLTENATEDTMNAIKHMVLGTIQKVKNALPVNLEGR